jgi:hypothetical protein
MQLGTFLLSTAETVDVPLGLRPAVERVRSASPDWRVYMAVEHPFWLYQDDEGTPKWRGSFADLDEAKHTARKLADSERHEFFIRRFDDFSQIARVFPTRSKTVDAPPDCT